MKVPARLKRKLAVARRREAILAAQQRQQLWAAATKKGRHLFAIDGGVL